jgi:kynurenine---oxoglutarate transaminase / cysteine-S-conjugate beta-lyase / glutamine---phenylpyruvate transaminase
MSLTSPSSTPTGGKATQFVPSDKIKNSCEPTVWHEFSPLAREYKAINLGQGFPGWDTPDFVKKAAVEAINNGANQYARAAGYVPLVDNIAKDYSKTLGREINPLTEVVITSGATGAICSSLQSLINHGDEVVIFEPFFDIYTAQIEIAGGTPVVVPLRARHNEQYVAEAGNEQAHDDDDDNSHLPGIVNTACKQEWYLDMKEFEHALTDKTRAVILNTPHNPTGKVFSESELKAMAIALQHFPDVVVIADEVYAHLTFDNMDHGHIASIPGMWERTITVGSAGKTFSCTGWKVGWTVAPAHLSRGIAISQQWVTFSINTPSQAAIASALEFARQPYENCESFYHWLRKLYDGKRKRLIKHLLNAGFTVPCHVQGSFFVVCDISTMEVPEQYLQDTTVERDWAFCRYLTKEIGVTAIPCTAFYHGNNKKLGQHYVRFAFCKPDDVLDEAGLRLLQLKH